MTTTWCNSLMGLRKDLNFHFGHRPQALLLFEKLQSQAAALVDSAAKSTSASVIQALRSKLVQRLPVGADRETHNFGSEYAELLVTPDEEKQLLIAIQGALVLITFDSPRDEFRSSAGNKSNSELWRQHALRPAITALKHGKTLLERFRPWPPASSLPTVVGVLDHADKIIKQLDDLENCLAAEDQHQLDARLATLLRARITPKVIATYIKELGYTVGVNAINTRASRLRAAGLLRNQPVSPTARNRKRPKTG